MTTYDLVVIGGGLSALSFLRAGGSKGATLLLEHQERLGGFLHPALPATTFGEAWELVRTFEADPAIEVRCATTAVGLLPASGPTATHTVLARGARGTQHIAARRVLLACGGLEITREHDQIPGTRPAGVVTPALIHQLLNRRYLPGHRPIVYGECRYAGATAIRLARVGAEVTLIPRPGHDPPSLDRNIRIEPPATLTEIGGFPRVEWIALQRDGAMVRVPTDTLVYAVGLVANTHWLTGSGVALTVQGAVEVDERYETVVRGVYAIGTAVAPSLDHVDSIAMGAAAANSVLRDIS